MMSALQSFAIVDWRPGAGQEAIAQAMVRGGMTGSQTVQFAADLAYTRDFVLWEAAEPDTIVFDADGRFRGMIQGVASTGVEALAGRTDREQVDAYKFVPIYGAAPMRSAPHDTGMGRDWPKHLALAIDSVLREIPRLQIGEPPAGEFSLLPAIPVLVAVAGAAIAVVGSVAAWRYFDPNTVTRTAAIAAASDAYAARLLVQRETGTLPPPGPLETEAAAVVEEAADQGSRDALLVGGGVAGGLAIGSVALAALRGRM